MFSGEEVPEYEINSHTVDCLYRMAQDSETREREAEVMMEDFEQKAEEYAAESEYTRKTFLLFHGKECECCISDTSLIEAPNLLYANMAAVFCFPS